MRGWQQIETAPKDAVIDVWKRYDDGTGQRVPDAFWVSDDSPPYWDDKRTEGWAAANMGYDGCDGWADDPDEGIVVTHWMPLPDPPSD